jgi:NAD-dependent SIR2 family protein deacetylase
MIKLVSRMRGILYKFEEDHAVIQVGGTARVFPRAIFPKQAVPGDVVEIEGDRVIILTNEPERLAKEFGDLMGKALKD